MSVSADIYVCTKQFKARLGDELSLQIGDRLEILADDSEYNDGWFMGRNTETNAVGLFPKSFAKIEPQLGSSQPTLLRSRSRRVLTPTSNSSTSALQTANSLPSPVATSERPSMTTAKTTPDVHSAMSEIDQALNDLQISSLDPQKTHKREPSASSVLTQDLDPTQALTWTAKQVSSYFAIVLGFDMDVAGMFARHKITGEILFQLDLSHLKELDIDSFGTRFEIHKEIERLRSISSSSKDSGQSRSSGMKSSEHLHQKPEKYTPKSDRVSSNDSKGSSRQASHSRLLPSADLSNGVSGRQTRESFKTHKKKRSQSLENIHSPRERSSRTFDSPQQTSFLSPRRAPEPPSPMNTQFRFGETSPNANAMRERSNNFSSRPASSIYEASSHHRRTSSGIGSIRRHSSVFSFLSGGEEPGYSNDKLQSSMTKLRSPGKEEKMDKRASKYFQEGDITIIADDLDIQDGTLSPKKNEPESKERLPESKKELAQRKLKGFRSASTQNFKHLTGSKKSKTSAFTEGIREINPDDAIKSCNFSGWMAKKSGSTLGWRSRYFTLHGTRLSYFTSLRDKREKGLIDITAHKVIPISTEEEGASSNDKYIALYASSAGYGRYCFKLVPPAPGFRKGLTFTQPKTHYFAVDSQEDMRGWMKALMTATIDIDDTVPVVSSCNTPTVSLAKAQELLAKAREETKLKDEELRAQGFFRGEGSLEEYFNDSVTSDEASSPILESLDETTLSSNTPGATNARPQPPLTIDTSAKSYRSPSTPQVSMSSGGFASPYLLASGLLSPKVTDTASPIQHHSPNSGTPQGSGSIRSDYFGFASEDVRSGSNTTPGDESTDVETPGSVTRALSGMKKKMGGDKLMAYTSDGSFVIKQKKRAQK